MCAVRDGHNSSVQTDRNHDIHIRFTGRIRDVFARHGKTWDFSIKIDVCIYGNVARKRSSKVDNSQCVRADVYMGELTRGKL